MSYREIYEQMPKPYETFQSDMLGEEFPKELETVSRLWFACGYRPGIAAYLNFFLLSDFITTHDTASAPRFHSFKSMGDSFYQTDLFIRDVTDSGLKPTGGISNPKVRDLLFQIMVRHQTVSIPLWMMTYFGFSLLENVEKQCAPLSAQEKQWHLQYMAKTYRIMGMPFSADHQAMEDFARDVEAKHAGKTSQLAKHSRNILLLGEMIGVSSRYNSIAAFLPQATREVFRGLYTDVQPPLWKSVGARLAGRLLMKQAIGAPRRAVPFLEIVKN